MNLTTGSAAVLAVAALVSMNASNAQVQPTPGPGSGVVNVVGKVEIANIPDVAAIQRGEWKVAVANTPDVRVTALPPLSFVRTGGRYEVTWPGGEKDTVRVVHAGSGGWVGVESAATSRTRWVNLGNARAVEELR
ncbi:MAG TPA: hypothetical protein VH740_11980 [Vicinamibacterales bacterium]|jgi:hypothetical protein